MEPTLKVRLKQGPVLEGPRLVAALRRLVEIGARVQREERANGGKSDDKAGGARGNRDQAR